MHVATVGLDLAKDIFQVHGITERGEVAFTAQRWTAGRSSRTITLLVCLVRRSPEIGASQERSIRDSQKPLSKKSLVTI